MIEKYYGRERIEMINDGHLAVGVLRELRRLVEERGFWQKGNNNAAGFPLEITGIDPYDALIRMIAGPRARSDAMRHLAEVAGGKDSRDVVAWLEKFGRTQDQVLAWIDKAIAKAGHS